MSPKLALVPSGRNFENEIISRLPQMMIKSTCFRCGAITIGRYADGSIEKWQREHDCEKPVREKLDFLNRFHFWLAF